MGVLNKAKEDKGIEIVVLHFFEMGTAIFLFGSGTFSIYADPYRNNTCKWTKYLYRLESA